MNSRLFVFLVVAFGAIPACILQARSVRRSDIPGDGVITCGPNAGFQPVCSGGVGSVSVASGQLTGSLSQGGSTLGITLAQGPALLTFSVEPPASSNPAGYDPQIVGPLGLNPLFQPTATRVGSIGLPVNLPPSLTYFDATVPLAGQAMIVAIRNAGASSISGISFSLGRDVNTLSTISTPQDDGLSFGLFCAGKMHAQGTADDCALPANWKLLLTPSGSGTLNPANTDPTRDSFGDFLSFDGVDLAPGEVGQFNFFLTDYTSTRTPPGGAFTPANESFVLEIDPQMQAVPEPSVAGLAGLLALVIGVAGSIRAIAQDQLRALFAAIAHPVASSRTESRQSGKPCRTYVRVNRR